mgnify:CR=1 FL=1
MSKIKLTNSGGGSSLEISAPNTNSDRTITLPDATGTLLTADGDGSSLSNAGPTTLASLSDATVSASDPTVSTNPSAAGHFWINKTTGKQYICTSNSSGNNIWKNLGGLSGNIS